VHCVIYLTFASPCAPCLLSTKQRGHHCHREREREVSRNLLERELGRASTMSQAMHATQVVPRAPAAMARRRSAPSAAARAPAAAADAAGVASSSGARSSSSSSSSAAAALRLRCHASQRGSVSRAAASSAEGGDEPEEEVPPRAWQTVSATSSTPDTRLEPLFVELNGIV